MTEKYVAVRDRHDNRRAWRREENYVPLFPAKLTKFRLGRLLFSVSTKALADKYRSRAIRSGNIFVFDQRLWNYCKLNFPAREIAVQFNFPPGGHMDAI